jgi:hypothetical protein
LSDHVRYRPTEDVVAQHMGEGVVLVHLRTNRIYDLNRTGARLWALLSEGRTRAEMRQRMLSEFDVDASTLERETDEILASMLAAQLVVVDGDR